MKKIFTLIALVSALPLVSRAQFISMNVPREEAPEFDLGPGLGSDLPSLTHLESLNDLIHEVPRVSWRWDRSVAELSAMQELAYLHERDMRGEGLPSVLQEGFSQNYTDILQALVDDRISEDCGRELMAAHRCLLQNVRQYFTQSRPFFGGIPNADRDKPFIEASAVRIAQLQGRLISMTPMVNPAEAPCDLRTPLLNGHQAWVEELLVWSCHCRRLSGGDIQTIRNRLHWLERAERSYKCDGRLTKYERDQLHFRLIELQRVVVESIRD